MALKKKTWKDYIPKTILIVYIVFSAIFILLSIVNYFRVAVYGVGFQDWVQTTLNQVLQQSSQCQVFSVGEVGLINVACLDQSQPEEVKK